MANNIGIIIEREYLERVKKKSFIFTTLLMPVVMLLFSLMPALIMFFAGTDQTSVLVIDDTGANIASRLNSDEEVTFVVDPSISRDSAMTSTDFSGVLVLPTNLLTAKSPSIKYFSNGPLSIGSESAIRSAVNNVVMQYRLEAHDIPGIEKIIEDSKVDVACAVVRLDKDDDGETTSSIVSYMAGLGLCFLLYMFVLLYGQMVMNSIIEEKTNRVLEVVVSSIKPTQLMMGKILGVGLVALTQILLWGIVLVIISAFVVPAVIPADIMADAAAVSAGAPSTSGTDPDVLNMVAAFTSMSSIGNLIVMIAIVTAYLILGFLLYASIFAAIGSAVDNLQDASQLSTWAVLPIGLGLIIALYAATSPVSQLAFWASLFPLTSPMVMVTRITFGIPSWEIWVSLFLLLLGFFFVVWLAGKIYRVGIFMYGKKPTVKDLIKWARYK